MVIFFVALLLFCFSISNHSTRIFVAIMSVLMAALIGWCIWTDWDSREEYGEDVWQNYLLVLWRTCGAVFERIKEFIPFHTRRVPDDGITLNSGLNEGRI